jgi:hypothetical protein
MLKVDESARPVSVDSVRESLGGAGFDVGQNKIDNAVGQNRKPESDGSGESANDPSVGTVPERRLLGPILRKTNFVLLAIATAIWLYIFFGK